RPPSPDARVLELPCPEDGRMRVRRVGPALVLVAGLALGSIQTSSASINWPIKVFTVSTPLAQRQEALANPYVSGLRIRVPWKRAEPSPGVYRWDAIDQALAQARAAGKLLMIRILAGIFTPDWVDAQVPTLTFSNAYLYNPKAYPSTATMPVPWDPRFLSLWRGFVDALGAPYDGDPTIYSVQMAGEGFVGEMTLPSGVGPRWAARYSDGMMIFAWESIIWEFRTAFPHPPLNLDITAPFPPPLHQTDVFGPVSTFAITGTQKAYIQG